MTTDDTTATVGEPLDWAAPAPPAKSRRKIGRRGKIAGGVFAAVVAVAALGGSSDSDDSDTSAAPSVSTVPIEAALPTTRLETTEGTTGQTDGLPAEMSATADWFLENQGPMLAFFEWGQTFSIPADATMVSLMQYCSDRLVEFETRFGAAGSADIVAIYSSSPDAVLRTYGVQAAQQMQLGLGQCALGNFDEATRSIGRGAEAVGEVGSRFDELAVQAGG